MKPPILVGVGLAVVVLAGALLAPLFVSADTKSTRLAQEQADLASRKLQRVTAQLPQIQPLVAPAADKAADLTGAVERSSETLRQIASDSAQRLQKAKSRGLDLPEPARLETSAAGMQKAVGAFLAAVKENDQLLNSAIQDAQNAVSTNANVPGVPQVLGMAQYLKAAEALVGAEALRDEQYAKQSELLSLALAWKETRGYADHYQGLQVDPILTGLQQDQEYISGQSKEAQENRDQLAKQVADAESALAAVVAEMNAAREALLKLENEGFKTGDDAAFNAYRERYAALSSKLEQAQQREQELRFGGRRGAELVGDDLSTAELAGGERVDGLEELKRRLAIAERRAEQLSGADKSLIDQIAFVKDMGVKARDRAKTYEARLAEFDARKTELLEAVKKSADAAFEAESNALKAAEAAVRAFGQSQTAMSGFIRAAREAAQNDTKRENFRLQTILSDPYLDQIGQSAEAAGRVLAARIQALRAQGQQRLITDLQLFAEIMPGNTIELATAEERMKSATTAGLETLEKARSIYEKMGSNSQAPASKTAWVPLGALAAAQHLTAQLDPTQAAKFMADAASNINKAVEKREQSPYLSAYVEYKRHLSGPSEPKADSATDDLFGGAEEGKGEKKAEEKKDEAKP